MTVDHIIPCVCTPHPPTCADRTTYGMPVLTACGYISRKQFWKIKCPVCGRGGLSEFRSSYKALKDWNHIMERCYEMEKKEIVLYDDFEKFYDPVSGKPYPEYQSGWDEL